MLSVRPFALVEDLEFRPSEEIRQIQHIRLHQHLTYLAVITSYSIHYTKLYEPLPRQVGREQHGEAGQGGQGAEKHRIGQPPQNS